MSAYYGKVIDLWQAGKIEEASSYFEVGEAEGQFSKEEIEKLKKILPERKEILIGVKELMKMYKEASPETREKIKKLLGLEI